MKILDHNVAPGSHAKLSMFIARLPTGVRIEIPVEVFRAKKEGPCVLLSAGLHGDEINGITILSELLKEKHFKKMKCGTVVVVPIINAFGFLNFSREVPDGKDINRSFPGSKNGSLAAVVANAMTKEILPTIDVAVDLHTGGASRHNHPQIRVDFEDSEALQLARLFQSPYIIHSSLIAKSFRKEAAKLKKPMLVYEGGESLRLDRDSIDQGKEGILRMLSGLDMLAFDSKARFTPAIIKNTQWVRAARAGLFQFEVQSGESVKKGQIIGRIHDPMNTYNVKVKSPFDGFTIGHNNMPVVNKGDSLFHIGER